MHMYLPTHILHLASCSLSIFGACPLVCICAESIQFWQLHLDYACVFVRVYHVDVNIRVKRLRVREYLYVCVCRCIHMCACVCVCVCAHT